MNIVVSIDKIWKHENIEIIIHKQFIKDKDLPPSNTVITSQIANIR